MLTVEQIMASHKANVETLLGLTSKAFEGIEKIIELNLTASKAALAETREHAKAMLSVKDAQELIALQSALLQPLAEKSAAYSRHLYDIASGSSAEFSRAYESKALEAQQNFLNLVERTAKNSPDGSESAVAVMRGAVMAANDALESVQKAVKQATDVAESNFKMIETSTEEGVKTAIKKRRRSTIEKKL